MSDDLGRVAESAIEAFEEADEDLREISAEVRECLGEDLWNAWMESIDLRRRRCKDAQMAVRAAGDSMGPFTVTKRGKNVWDNSRAVQLSSDRDEWDDLVEGGVIKQSFDHKRAQAVLDPAVFAIYKDRCHKYEAGASTAVSGPKVDDDVFSLL